MISAEKSFSQETAARLCLGCWTEKPVAAFSAGRSRCRACRVAETAAYRKAHPGQRKNSPETGSAYRAANREKLSAQNKIWHAKHHDEQLAKRKAWYAKNRDGQLVKMKAYHAANREKILARRKANPRKILAWRLGHEYGLSLEAYETMLTSQGGACAICRTQMKNPHVDHDHQTGNVRGLLCFRCNPAVGLFRDNAVVIRSAAEYLEKVREETTRHVETSR
jgi:hypothetical protein